MVEQDIKVTVAVLGQKLVTVTELCSKMDQVIEKLMNQHDRHMEKVYDDMDNHHRETDADISEIHLRIDTVLEKVQATEKTLLGEIKSLRIELQDHNIKEKETLSKLLEWKWMVAGGIFVLSWLLSHVKLDTILTGFK
jgi:hypothetical protein